MPLNSPSSLMLISYFLLLLLMMMSIAFFVLLERKILSSIHLREGPKKMGILGLLQPMGDGGKLFSKTLNFPLKSDFMIFMISPILGLSLCFFMWMLYETNYDNMNMILGFLIFLSLSSMNVYVMVMSGWSSNSIYGIIGSYRGVAQCISYEITMALLMMGLMTIIMIYNFKEFLNEKGIFSLFFLTMIIWFSVILAETNRSPYDFVEGESELVSGFNVEYSSIGFSFLFLSEYGSMMFMAYSTEIMFWGENNGYLMSILIISLIWIRGVLPRFRYDKLMLMTWKFYLFYSLSSLTLYLGMTSILSLTI